MVAVVVVVESTGFDVVAGERLEVVAAFVAVVVVVISRTVVLVAVAGRTTVVAVAIAVDDDVLPFHLRRRGNPWRYCCCHCYLYSSSFWTLIVQKRVPIGPKCASKYC